jgi:hypothetical protein
MLASYSNTPLAPAWTITNRGHAVTNSQEGGADFGAAVENLRRLTRARFEVPQELLNLRLRIAIEQERAHRKILERVAGQAHVELEPKFEEARRRNAAKRRVVSETLTQLGTKAAEQAKEEKAYFHRIRAQYLEAFGGHPPARAGQSELKFHDPIVTSSTAHPDIAMLSLVRPARNPTRKLFPYGAESRLCALVWIWKYLSPSSRMASCSPGLCCRTGCSLVKATTSGRSGYCYPVKRIHRT